jgi:hypothetical protein
LCFALATGVKVSRTKSAYPSIWQNSKTSTCSQAFQKQYRFEPTNIVSYCQTLNRELNTASGLALKRSEYNLAKSITRAFNEINTSWE